MTDQQPNAWQNRPRNTQQQATARTPQQSRSGSMTPRGSGGSQTVNQERNIQTGNTWTQNEPNTNTSKTYTPLNGFNAGEVKVFLRSQSSSDSDTSVVGSGTIQTSKSAAMASGQSFYAVLAKQVAALENGG